MAQLALLLVLLVPLLPGTWAFSELAARRETSRVDTHLQNALAAALNEYRRVQNEAQERAHTAALATPVQRAFIRRDRAALNRLERQYPGVQLLLPGERMRVADPSPGYDVVDNKQKVGRVVAPIRLQGEVLVNLRRAAGLQASERVAILRDDAGGASNRPSTITFGGVTYRGVAVTLRQKPTRIRLAVMRDRDAVRAAVDAARRRTVIVAVFALVAVSLLAYLFAPALARTRVRRRQRSQAERLLTLLSDGVLEIDENGVIAFVNPAAETLLGYDAKHLLGRQATDALPSYLLPEAPSDVRVGENGRENWLAVASAEAEGGRIFTFRDVTRERRLEEMRTDLIATVSHELRTPLAAVYGAAMTLQRTPQLDGRMREQLISIIGKQAERLARIVDDVLTASRAAETDAPPPEEFDAVAVAEAVVHDAAERTGRDITLDVHDGRPRASGNPDGLRRVLDNLVDNAIKYAPGASPIAVHVGNGGETVKIAVADDGPGIPREEQERIFERFYRLDPAMASGVGGTGLGLYIARRLMEQMGGKLLVSSEPGHGTTFTTELRRA
jgi:two-component system, OmpR family, phosphate regulon sensor histidine kinase PhoR